MLARLDALIMPYLNILAVWSVYTFAVILMASPLWGGYLLWRHKKKKITALSPTTPKEKYKDEWLSSILFLISSLWQHKSIVITSLIILVAVWLLWKRTSYNLTYRIVFSILMIYSVIHYCLPHY